MKIIHSLNNTNELKHPTALAIGIFDGIHQGHLSVIKKALAAAKADGLSSVVLTFRTFGDNIVKKDRYIEKIISEELFFEILENIGVDVVAAIPFEEIREFTPDEFVSHILKDKFNAKFVSCGRDFHFGKNAAGDWQDLERLGKQEGIDAIAANLVMHKGEPISSTRIRACIKEGDMSETNDMLGHRYAIDFKVVGGNKIGRTLGMPTINQPYPSGYLVPKFGVYATLTKIGETWYTSVTNVGTKPTVGGGDILAETYIQGFSGNLYGERVKVEFLQFLRREQKFGSLEDLRNRIELDSVEAKNIGSLYLETKNNHKM